MPNWSNTKCVDAEETKIVSEPSWPVSASGSFAIDIDGTEYTSNVAIVFEVSQWYLACNGLPSCAGRDSLR